MMFGEGGVVFSNDWNKCVWHFHLRWLRTIAVFSIPCWKSNNESKLSLLSDLPVDCGTSKVKILPPLPSDNIGTTVPVIYRLFTPTPSSHPCLPYSLSITSKKRRVDIHPHLASSPFVWPLAENLSDIAWTSKIIDAGSWVCARRCHARQGTLLLCVIKNKTWNERRKQNCEHRRKGIWW